VEVAEPAAAGLAHRVVLLAKVIPCTIRSARNASNSGHHFHDPVDHGLCCAWGHGKLSKTVLLV
jgi:hypothetical protein